MSIVTKKGDGGQTSLYGGERVPKSCARVDAYGDIDELSAFLGFARAQSPGEALEAMLVRVQTELLTVGAVLATGKKSTAKVVSVSPAWAVQMEAEVKAFEKVLPPLKKFILPGSASGGERHAAQTSAALHMARTVARRAERKVAALSQLEEVPTEVLVYLNRLSDLLFVAARAAAEMPDASWAFLV